MIFKRDIEKLILQRKRSNFINHLLTTIFFDKTKYSGEIKENKILLWYCSHQYRGGYPIFILEFDQNDKLLEIKTQKNEFDKWLLKSSLVLVTILIIWAFMNGHIRVAIATSIIAIVLIILIRALLTNIYNEVMSLQKEELKSNMAQIEFERNPEIFSNPSTRVLPKRENEWSLSKIITRLFTYPFCIIIIWISLNHFLPEGKNKFGLFGIFVPSIYLVIDLILVFRKGKDANI